MATKEHYLQAKSVVSWEYTIRHSAIIISYYINTTKYWLRAIFKENELVSSPLILHKANILWYWCNNCSIVWLKVFVTLHNDSVARPTAYVARQNFLSQSLSHHTATFVFIYEGWSERIFSFIGFSEIVQYLRAYNIAKYCTLSLH